MFISTLNSHPNHDQVSRKTDTVVEDTGLMKPNHFQNDLNRTIASLIDTTEL